MKTILNNAGYGLGGPLESYSEEQIAHQVNTNLLSVIRVTQAFVPYFRAKRSGMLLSVTSIGGVITFPFYSVYSATKWGVEGFCESLSFEMKQFGVAVKTISPGGKAVTDGKDQLRYQAGPDAVNYVAQRKQMGDETFRQHLNELFFHS